MRHTICVCVANFLSLAPLSMHKNRSMIRQRENVSHIYLMEVVRYFWPFAGATFFGCDVTSFFTSALSINQQNA